MKSRRKGCAMRTRPTCPAPMKPSGIALTTAVLSEITGRRPEGWFSLPRQGDKSRRHGTISPHTVDLLIEAGYAWLRQRSGGRRAASLGGLTWPLAGQILMQRCRIIIITMTSFCFCFFRRKAPVWNTRILCSATGGRSATREVCWRGRHFHMTLHPYASGFGHRVRLLEKFPSVLAADSFRSLKRNRRYRRAHSRTGASTGAGRAGRAGSGAITREALADKRALRPWSLRPRSLRRHVSGALDLRPVHDPSRRGVERIAPAYRVNDYPTTPDRRSASDASRRISSRWRSAISRPAGLRNPAREKPSSQAILRRPRYNIRRPLSGCVQTSGWIVPGASCGLIGVGVTP